MDVITWDVIKIIASVQIMTGTIDKNNTLVIHAVDVSFATLSFLGQARSL